MKKSVFYFLLLCTCLMGSFPIEHVNAAPTFNLSPTGNAMADAGFAEAAANIAQLLDDDVTINITTGFIPLGAGVLGSAGSTKGTVGFSTWKTAMANDIIGADDLTMVSNLPDGSSFNVYINYTSDNPNGSGSSTPYLDSDGGANNTTVRITTANAKSVGLLAAHDAEEDAVINFSSNFSWDFDPSNGITGGTYDFVGVAMHELIHAMGFISGVDILDLNSPGTNGPFNDNAFSYVNSLDFTRHSAASLGAGADIDWRAGTDAKFFSIDGGTTIIESNAWSTGRTHGDGQQASHWKDNKSLGIEDPTAAIGQLLSISALDIQALDVIGWDLVVNVPEPSSVATLGLIIMTLFLRRQQLLR